MCCLTTANPCCEMVRLTPFGDTMPQLALATWCVLTWAFVGGCVLAAPALLSSLDAGGPVMGIIPGEVRVVCVV